MNLKILDIEIVPETFDFIQKVSEVNAEFKQLPPPDETPEPIFLIGLTQTQCAQLKDIFEKAKRYEYLNHEAPAETENLYKHIYIQVAAKKL